MFSYIKGNLEIKNRDYIVVDVNGVGFKIFMSENSMRKIGSTGEVVKVHTYVKVREDDISIYGFSSIEELRMFDFLISVSGVGSKSAIAILSNIEPSAFAVAVVSDDVNCLKKLPGIGAKSAARIILELKDKLKDINKNEAISEETASIIKQSENIEELISALQVLGYAKKDIELVIPKIKNKEESIENLIKEALILLSK